MQRLIVGFLIGILFYELCFQVYYRYDLKWEGIPPIPIFRTIAVDVNTHNILCANIRYNYFKNKIEVTDTVIDACDLEGKNYLKYRGY